MGVLPNIFLRPIEPSVERMLGQVRQGAAVQIHARSSGTADCKLRIANCKLEIVNWKSGIGNQQ
jgi:hypothetical protein